MRLLLDTNRYNDLVTRDREVVQRFQDASQVWLSLITIGELRAGFANGSRRKSNESKLAEVLHLQGVEVLVPDIETTHVYGRLFAELHRSGGAIPTNDLWIAAQALQHNLTLDTRDAHFHRVPGLRLVTS